VIEDILHADKPFLDDDEKCLAWHTVALSPWHRLQAFSMPQSLVFHVWQLLDRLVSSNMFVEDWRRPD